MIAAIDVNEALAAVRDDPAGRLAYASATYERWGAGRAPYKRAALSFMRWEEERGLLGADGSPWWRALNERLLLDAATGRDCWADFIARPSPDCWYRAHNHTIVAAYLEHRDLAERENRAERFFLNVVLARVLYAHALVAAPRLALGRLAPVARVLGDPRLGIAGAFLSLGRVLPDRYPAEDAIEFYRSAEHPLGMKLDFGIIQPRLRGLYDWSARELGQPGLAALLVDGVPAYAWEPADVGPWYLPQSRTVRALQCATR